MIALLLVVLSQVQATCGSSPQRPCYTTPVQNGVIIDGNTVIDGSKITVTQSSGHSIDAELVYCRTHLADSERQLVRQELWLVPGFISFLILLTVTFALSRLDRIVAAWRRSELPRVPWLKLGKWISFLLALGAWNIVAHWVVSRG